MAEVPGWLSAGLAALLGFAATWGALRATMSKQAAEMSEVKRELHEMRRDLGPLLLLTAEVKTLVTELGRLREHQHRIANDVMGLIARVAVVEDRQSATGKHRRLAEGE